VTASMGGGGMLDGNAFMVDSATQTPMGPSDGPDHRDWDVPGSNGGGRQTPGQGAGTYDMATRLSPPTAMAQLQEKALGDVGFATGAPEGTKSLARPRHDQADRAAEVDKVLAKHTRPYDFGHVSVGVTSAAELFVESALANAGARDGEGSAARDMRAGPSRTDVVAAGAGKHATVHVQRAVVTAEGVSSPAGKKGAYDSSAVEKYINEGMHGALQLNSHSRLVVTNRHPNLVDNQSKSQKGFAAPAKGVGIKIDWSDVTVNGEPADASAAATARRFGPTSPGAERARTHTQ
jgi:hypothetical protein